VKAGEDLVKLKKGCWGTNHARVGKFLLEQWNLPEFMVVADDFLIFNGEAFSLLTFYL
jgi:hypothetical protein